MLLMIDNYDSFTYNLVQYLGELGQRVAVYRNDQITLDDVEVLAPAHIVISPGPCTPNEAGICVDLIWEPLTVSTFSPIDPEDFSETSSI